MLKRYQIRLCLTTDSQSYPLPFYYCSYNFITTIFPQELLLFHVLSMAGELDPFFWTMSSVVELKVDLLTAPAMELAFITVAIMKMLGFSAEIVSGVYTRLRMAIYARKVTVQHEILATGKLVVSSQ